MSLRKINSRSLVSRLVISTFSLLLLSLFLVTSVIYYLFALRLQEADKELLLRLSKNYAVTYQERGIEALKEEISPDIMFQIVSEREGVIFSRMPQYIDSDFEDENEIEQIKKEAGNIPLKEGLYTLLLLSGEENIDFFHRLEYKLRLFAWKKNWQIFLPLIDNDMVEVLVVPLPENRWIKIGRSSEIREEQLAEIRYLSGIVFLPFLFIGILLSYLLARKILAPVKELARTIHQIKGGASHVRAIPTGSGDEVDLLTNEFNSLLDRNQSLVENLQTTVNNIAHDLRTPMTRFRSSAESALLSGDVETLKEALADGVENSDRILKLLNAIMDVAEADTGMMIPVKKTVNVTDLIASIIDIYSIVAEEKQIILMNEIQGPVYVPGNEARLMQVFANLLDNAIKYSPASSKIIFSANTYGNQTEIHLHDFGRGIPEHELGKIWNKLYRGDKSRNTSGLGLGLSLVRAIVHAHGGSVKAISEEGKGSVFTVTLPTCNDSVRVL